MFLSDVGCGSRSTGLHHAAHAVVVTVAGIGLLLLREVRDQALRGEQEAGDRGRVLQGAERVTLVGSTTPAA